MDSEENCEFLMSILADQQYWWRVLTRVFTIFGHFNTFPTDDFEWRKFYFCTIQSISVWVSREKHHFENHLLFDSNNLNAFQLDDTLEAKPIFFLILSKAISR